MPLRSAFKRLVIGLGLRISPTNVVQAGDSAPMSSMIILRCTVLSFVSLLCLIAQSPAGRAETPVRFDGRELWTVKASRADFSAAERAKDIESNLLHAAQDLRLRLDDIREIPGESDTLLLVGRVFLFAVTDDDAQLEQKSREELFEERKNIALQALIRYRDARSASALLRSVAIAVTVLVGAVLALALLRWLYHRLKAAIAREFTKISPRGQIGAVYATFRGTVRLAVLFLLRALFLTTAIVVVLTVVPVILGLFPATAHLSASVLSTSIGVVGGIFWSIVNYLPSLLILGIIAALTYGLIRASKAITNAIASGLLSFSGFHREWAQPTHDLVRILLIMFALVVAFPYLPGGDSPALRGASIFIGVLVSLGSGSAMGNVIAGIILTYMRPFQAGDRVKIGDTLGDVVEKTLLVTRVRTTKNVEVIVPNGAILGNHILNYSALAKGRGLILNTTVTIGYDAPWMTVHELLINAALKTEGVLKEPRPFVFQTSLNDFNVSYEINAFTAEANRMAEIYSELHRNIQDEFNAGGVEIMSPNYLALRDGNTITIPEDQRPPDYVSPSFRVKSQSASAGSGSTLT